MGWASAGVRMSNIRYDRDRSLVDIATGLLVLILIVVLAVSAIGALVS